MQGPADGIDREAVDSSHIASLGYSADRRVLAVEFKSGAIFHYRDVEPLFAAEFYGALSKGQFFNMHVRRKLAGEKMTRPCAHCGAPGVIGSACVCGAGEHFREEMRYAERTE